MAVGGGHDEEERQALSVGTAVRARKPRSQGVGWCAGAWPLAAAGARRRQARIGATMIRSRPARLGGNAACTATTKSIS